MIAHLHAPAVDGEDGLGRGQDVGARHRVTPADLDVLDVWVHEKLNSKAATIGKVLGADHPADLLTKYKDRAVLVNALNDMGTIFMDGRPDCAPAAMGA